MFLPLSRDYQQGNLTNTSVSKQEKLKTLHGIYTVKWFCCCCCYFKIGISYHLMKKPVSSSNYPGPSSGRHKSKSHVYQPPFFCPSPCPNLFVQFMFRLLLLHKSALTPELTDGRLFPEYLEDGTPPPDVEVTCVCVSQDERLSGQTYVLCCFESCPPHGRH